jgi:cellulose synthase/poly-beta-1,6-N-acetylglucosamine synthase-like glycosyltransferase
MTYYLSIVFALYFLTLITLLLGWNRATQNLSISNAKQNFITIIIAARNEEKNITNLLNSLLHLKYDRKNFEIILVNDHSEDTTLLIGNEFFRENGMGRIVSLKEGSGKKTAITYGVSLAKGNIVAVTDSDCVVPADWLQRINQMFQNDDLQLCVGAVKIISDGKVFSSLQSLEFASVIGTGAATLGLGNPTMCNGANLSFRKKSFEEVNGYEGNFSYASGDDQFLMAKIEQHYPKSISFMSFPDSVVCTIALNSLSSFFSQRIRWAGKWSAMSGLTKMLAVFTFLVQVSWIFLLILFFYNPLFAVPLIFIKFLLEFIFLYRIGSFLSSPFQPISFLVLQFLYAPYVIGTAIFSQVMTFRWKGRKHTG